MYFLGSSMPLTTKHTGRMAEWSCLSHQSLRWRGFKSHSCYFLDIPIQNNISCFFNTCTWYLLPSSRLVTRKHTGRMAEWPKALVQGISHFGGVGSNLTLVILLKFLYKVLFPLFWTAAHGIFYHNPCYWPQYIQAGWLSGMRRWFKALVTSLAWVQVPLLSFCLHSYTFLYIPILFLVFWTPAHGVIYHYPCYWQQNIEVRWLCSLWCWLKGRVTAVALVWVKLLTFCRRCYTKYCILYIEHLQMVSFTSIHTIDHCTYRRDSQVV